MAPRSLISILDLAPSEIDDLLAAAERFLPPIRQGRIKLATLRGVSTVLAFFEPSTRTRVSFELAGKLLGSDTINLGGKGSSVEKGETVQDTAQTLSAMGFGIAVVRHQAADAAARFARYFAGATLNAGSGRGQHPTQALLDALCLRLEDRLKPGVRLGIVGDLAHSRVMRSNVQLLTQRGVHVVLIAPPQLMPAGWRALEPAAWAGAKAAQEMGTLSWETDLDRALPELDVVMLLRVQRERMAGGTLPAGDEYSALYGLNRRRLKLLKPAARILHPGPVNRGVELTEEVFADPRCRINDQVACGVALRLALLAWCQDKLNQALRELPSSYVELDV